MTAIIDVYSRFIVGWNLSNTLEASHCTQVLKEAIAKYGAPEIINSDQGGQFTSEEWVRACKEYDGLRISMDGKGRANDNIWIERFWRTIKYEYIYSTPEEDGKDLFDGIARFTNDYNYNRYHQGINHKTPSMLYLNSNA